MTESAPAIGKTRFTDWLLRAAVGFVFASLGWEKITARGDTMWFTLFAHIGWGQWFRYFTGALQIAGGILMVVPRTAPIGTFILAGTMAGAILFHLFVLGDPFSSIIPALLLVAIVIIGKRGNGDADEMTKLEL